MRGCKEYRREGGGAGSSEGFPASSTYRLLLYLRRSRSRTQNSRTCSCSGCFSLFGDEERKLDQTLGSLSPSRSRLPDRDSLVSSRDEELDGLDIGEVFTSCQGVRTPVAASP